MARIWPSALPNTEYEIDFLLKKSSGTVKKEIMAVKEKISFQLIACFLLALAIGIWYFMTKVNGVLLFFCFMLFIEPLLYANKYEA